MKVSDEGNAGGQEPEAKATDPVRGIDRMGVGSRLKVLAAGFDRKLQAFSKRSLQAEANALRWPNDLEVGLSVDFA